MSTAQLVMRRARSDRQGRMAAFQVRASALHAGGRDHAVPVRRQRPHRCLGRGAIVFCSPASRIRSGVNLPGHCEEGLPALLVAALVPSITSAMLRLLITQRHEEQTRPPATRGKPGSGWRTTPTVTNASQVDRWRVALGCRIDSQRCRYFMIHPAACQYQQSPFPVMRPTISSGAFAWELRPAAPAELTCRSLARHAQPAMPPAGRWRYSMSLLPRISAGSIAAVRSSAVTAIWRNSEGPEAHRRGERVGQDDQRSSSSARRQKVTAITGHAVGAVAIEVR